MNKRIRLLCSLAILALVAGIFSVATQLYAQQGAPEQGGTATYDIDRQDLAKQHEGKKVRIAGVLDPNGKMIHVK
jgi:hypothetical protein